MNEGPAQKWVRWDRQVIARLAGLARVQLGLQFPNKVGGGVQLTTKQHQQQRTRKAMTCGFTYCSKIGMHVGAHLKKLMAVV